MWDAKQKSTDELRKWATALQKSLDGKWSITNCIHGVNHIQDCPLCVCKVTVGHGDHSCKRICPVHARMPSGTCYHLGCCKEFADSDHHNDMKHAYAMRDRLLAVLRGIEHELKSRETPKRKMLVPIMLDAEHAERDKEWELWRDGSCVQTSLYGYHARDGVVIFHYRSGVTKQSVKYLPGHEHELRAPKGWKPVEVEGCYVKNPPKKVTTIKGDCKYDGRIPSPVSHAASETRLTRYLLRALSECDPTALKQELQERLGCEQ